MVFKGNRLSARSEEIFSILLFVLLMPYLFMVMTLRKHVITNKSTYKLNKQIFILAGQSNMAGQGGVTNYSWDGIVPPECHSHQDILRLAVSLRWQIAKEPLNYGVDCLHNCGVGHGMAFANAVLKKDPNFGFVGLVPCSVSGKGIRSWSPGNFPYDQLLRRVNISLRDGGELRGLLWFHGESDSKHKFDATHYKPRLQKFIKDLRTDLNYPLLPVLMVVLHIPKPPFKRLFGRIVRQAQLEVELRNVAKVDANGLPLNPDGIHLALAAQIRLGNMLADAFLNSNFTSARKSSSKVYHMMSST